MVKTSVKILSSYPCFGIHLFRVQAAKGYASLYKKSLYLPDTEHDRYIKWNYPKVTKLEQNARMQYHLEPSPDYAYSPLPSYPMEDVVMCGYYMNKKYWDKNSHQIPFTYSNGFKEQIGGLVSKLSFFDVVMFVSEQRHTMQLNLQNPATGAGYYGNALKSMAKKFFPPNKPIKVAIVRLKGVQVTHDLPLEGFSYEYYNISTQLEMLYIAMQSKYLILDSSILSYYVSLIHWECYGMALPTLLLAGTQTSVQSNNVFLI